MNPRTKIFISHATPKDNEFVIWLATRLRNEGYDIWYDLEGLLGGEFTWDDITNVIKNETVKFIFVVSETSVKAQGALNELNFAISVAKEFQFNDFIIPLKIDDSSFNSRIELTRINFVRFDISLAHGLKKLLLKFNKDNVPNNLAPGSVLKNLIYITDKHIIKKKETYYTNWVKIKKIPQKIFFFQFDNKTQADNILRINDTYPFIQHDNYLIGFSNSLKPLLLKDGLYETLIKEKDYFSFSVSKILKGYDGIKFPNSRDSYNFLVRLLRECFNKYLLNRELNVYELANNVQSYYYIDNQLVNNKVKYLYEKKEKKKKLVGKYFQNMWHFAISIKVVTSPVVCFNLKSHIIFSDDGKNIWDNKDKMHTARRKKGKGLFNEGWRDLLLAFLSSLSDNNSIYINVSEDNRLEMDTTTVKYISDFGYIEPESNARLKPLDDFLSNYDEEENDEDNREVIDEGEEDDD